MNGNWRHNAARLEDEKQREAQNSGDNVFQPIPLGPHHGGQIYDNQSHTVRVVDRAGNETSTDFTTLTLPRKDNRTPLGIVEWESRRSKASAAPAISAVHRLSHYFNETRDQIDTDEWPVFAAWLNLATGHLPPDGKADVGVDNCQVSQRPNTQNFALLWQVDDCLRELDEKAEPNRKRIFLQVVADHLTEVGILGASEEKASRRGREKGARPRVR